FALRFSPLCTRPAARAFPTRRSSDLVGGEILPAHPPRHPVGVVAAATDHPRHRYPLDRCCAVCRWWHPDRLRRTDLAACSRADRSEEHTSELQSRFDLVCRLLLEKRK